MQVLVVRQDERGKGGGGGMERVPIPFSFTCVRFESMLGPAGVQTFFSQPPYAHLPHSNTTKTTMFTAK